MLYVLFKRGSRARRSPCAPCLTFLPPIATRSTLCLTLYFEALYYYFFAQGFAVAISPVLRSFLSLTSRLQPRSASFGPKCLGEPTIVKARQTYVCQPAVAIDQTLYLFHWTPQQVSDHGGQV